jgi:hypothetical protein
VVSVLCVDWNQERFMRKSTTSERLMKSSHE